MPSLYINRDPRRRFGTVAVLSSAHLFLWSVQGALPAVFPPFARWKHLTTAQYSSVFGFFSLIRLVVGCFDNELLSLTRPKFYVVNGIFLLGGITLLHGVLRWSPPGYQFYLLSFLLQALSGVAVAFLQNTSLLVLDLAFPTHALYYVAVLESFSLAGLLTGPIFALVALVGNYATPFLLFGIFLLATSFFAQLCLEDESPAFEWCASNDAQDLVRIPLVKCAQLLAFLNSAADAFLLVTLTEHLLKFGISGHGQVSALYLLNYICYGAAYVLIKNLTSTGFPSRSMCKSSELLCSSVGCLACAFGFMSLGPSNFVNVNPSLVLLGFGLVLRGLGCGCLTSCTNVIILRAARKRLRLPYDTQTCALVNRMTSLPASAGYCCGAFSCSVMDLDPTGSMHTASSVFLILFLIMSGVCFACHFTSRRQESLSAEETPLCDCSVRLDPRSPFPSSPTDLLPSDEDWQWLIQKRDEDDKNFMQPSL